MFPVQVEAVGLVTGLRGTGEDPKPSPLRAALLAEMQTRGVARPNAVLASRDTALVKIRGVLRPGIQKGDRFDVEVRVPSQSETTSLRGGRLLEARLSELAVLEGQVHSGQYLAKAEGPVMVDPSADAKEDRVLSCRGQVLGGGICQKSRPLALVLKPGRQSVFNASRIETAVNKRFHIFQKGVKAGVAKAKTDEYVELAVHPRYKDNIHRYVSVVRSLALRETEPELMLRLAELEKELLDPATSSRAALALEAVGNEGVRVLAKGVESRDAEVRFYSAEALAYLDRGEAVAVLAETARNFPAFRVFALTALSAMEDVSARDELRDLLEVSSAETRYGAFRALWAMNPNDPLVAGEPMNGQFSYHVLDVSGPTMMHVTRSHRPELVLFGRDQRLTCPLALEAGNRILVRGTAAGEIAVSKFAVGEPDQKRIVSDRLDDVIRAIVELGGTYPDVVQALQEAKSAGALASRFEVDAVPAAGRTYDRLAADAEGGESPRPRTAGRPDLFADMGDQHSTREDGPSPETDQDDPESTDSGGNDPSAVGFFGRIFGRKPG